MRFVPWILFAAWCVLRAAIASSLDPLADEALYWTWSLSPSWGYYDQPPGVVAAIRVGTWLLGATPLALRAVGLVACAVALADLSRCAPEGKRLLGLWSLLPVLFGLTLLAVPDALRIAAWAAGLAAALRGRWVLLGLFTAAATLARHDGIVLLPLVALALRPRPLDLARASAVCSLALAPHLCWLADHGFVTVAFQASEGLWKEGRSWWGPLWMGLDQLSVATPLGVLAALVVAAQGPGEDPVRRLGWWTSVPLFAFFLAASLGAPPEAHWPASAWLGVGLVTSTWTGARLRLLWMWMGLSGLVTFAAVWHVFTPLVPLPADPADQFRQGKVLAEAARPWLLPEGALAHDSEARAIRVDTERYQEAAWLQWFLGVDSGVAPGCGRHGQNDLSSPRSPSPWFVRPATGGPPSCVSVGARHVLRGVQPATGRLVGRWDLFERSP